MSDLDFATFARDDAKRLAAIELRSTLRVRQHAGDQPSLKRPSDEMSTENEMERGMKKSKTKSASPAAVCVSGSTSPGSESADMSPVVSLTSLSLSASAWSRRRRRLGKGGIPLQLDMGLIEETTYVPLHVNFESECDNKKKNNFRVKKMTKEEIDREWQVAFRFANDFLLEFNDGSDMTNTKTKFTFTEKLMEPLYAVCTPGFKKPDVDQFLQLRKLMEERCASQDSAWCVPTEFWDSWKFENDEAWRRNVCFKQLIDCGLRAYGGMRVPDEYFFQKSDGLELVHRLMVRQLPAQG